VGALRNPRDDRTVDTSGSIPTIGLNAHRDTTMHPVSM
jgi:hypothetical protein